jgi:hypothetical protein
MKQKIQCILILIFLNFSLSAFPQEDSETMPLNIGLSLNLLGPVFGIYSLGISTIMTQRIQIGLYGTYFDTRNIDPNVTGWQTQVRMNYFFSPLYKSGFYLGVFGGFESVKVQNSSGNYDSYSDPIGGLVPGYRWVMTRRLGMLLGIIVGYMYGDTQISPEITFIYIF